MYTCMVMEEKDLVKKNNGPSKFYLNHLNDPPQYKLSREQLKCNEKKKKIGQFSDQLFLIYIILYIRLIDYVQFSWVIFSW